MRGIAVAISFALSLAAKPAAAEQSSIAAATEAGMSACYRWVLEPRTWAENESGFASTIGLGDRLQPIEKLPAGLLPTAVARRRDSFWRIDGGQGNGVFVAASTIRPECDVIGGGPTDFQPEVEPLLLQPKFAEDWKRNSHELKADTVTDTFSLNSDPKAELVVTRANQAGLRTDRVQFFATLTYQIGKP